MLASLLQVLSIGLGLAGYYALVAVGFALIFATLRIFHVAHGTVFIIAGYTFFGLKRSPAGNKNAAGPRRAAGGRQAPYAAGAVSDG